MTGLALLAFLASGHTHLDGPYRDDVRRGLEYLMRTQAADGNLGGQAAAVRVHVLPCDGRLCAERGLWNDARRSGCASRSAGPSAIPSRRKTRSAAAGATGPATPATPANSAGN